VISRSCTAMDESHDEAFDVATLPGEEKGYTYRKTTWQGRPMVDDTCYDARLTNPHPSRLFPRLCEVCRSIDFGALWTFWRGYDGMWPAFYFPDDWPLESGDCSLCALWLYWLETNQESRKEGPWVLRFNPTERVPEAFERLVPLALTLRLATEPEGSTTDPWAYLFPEERCDATGPFVDYASVGCYIDDTPDGDGGHNGGLKVPIDIKLIDCNKLEIVNATTRSTYLALSYVVGEHQFDMAASVVDTKLRLDECPRTIRDAVAFARNLGEQYLWVDAVCITALNETERQRQLSAMAHIYAEAKATLVSLGESNDTPIPGVSQERAICFDVATSGGCFRVDTSVIERRMRQSPCKYPRRTLDELSQA
jgi:hypothetical protein